MHPGLDKYMMRLRMESKERENQEAIEQYREILRDLERLRTQIEQVDSNFNMATDEDLVESYIYEANALAARYRFLLREAKEQKSRLGKAAFFVGITGE